MLKITNSVVLGFGLALGLSASANAAPTKTTVAVVQGSERHLENADGRSLYTFGKDAPGKSACNLLCAAAWPPLLAPTGSRASGHWSLVKRESGLTQWAYNGSPLYTYLFDFKPGDVRGDGAEGVWHLARP
jgi:predicted lipoprotein with Yx(FWY)xxD motif